MKQSEDGLLIKPHNIFGPHILFIVFAHVDAHRKPIQNTENEHIGFRLWFSCIFQTNTEHTLPFGCAVTKYVV